ncbi:MAG TPA: hypothetical protein PKN48_16095 [Bacteroidales bacterium]|nr:hypothetical protein [Bacteroidales bacterium]
METTIETKKKPNIFMYVSIILLIACAVLTWQLISSKKTIQQQNDTIVNVNEEKAQTIAKLENLKKEYEQLSKDNEQLSTMFNEEKAHVEKLLEKIKNSEGSVAKYRNQVASMENRLKEYEQQIAELKQQNKELVEDNFHIKTTLDSTTTENKELTTANEELTQTVNKGSVLTSYDINADGIFIRNKVKEIPTQRTKRVEKIRVCFTIGENAIATAGNKTVYLRVADPNGTILAQGEGDEYSFDFNGKKLQYSAKENINYNNKSMDLCLYWNKTKEITPGTYTIDIFADNAVIGTTTFKLEK